MEILVDPLGKPLPFSEVTGTKAKGDAASVGDYVFGLTAKGRYNDQPLSGKGKIGGMLALRSEGTPFPGAGGLSVPVTPAWRSWARSTIR
ncbi:AsmA family protein [Enterobacter asburiae]|uniref:AsmA family protein n=1 Tax=Enterobacter asburiae TaxID=61645 RepID=A0A376FDL3_ENTAS|nr:AsmA family protein [Enterobacter asburiae]